jgi:hypothetical protein
MPGIRTSRTNKPSFCYWIARISKFGNIYGHILANPVTIEGLRESRANHFVAGKPGLRNH